MAKYYVIPKAAAIPWSKQIRYTWHAGIQATEIADGTFIISEDVIKEFGLHFGKKSVAVNDVDVVIDVELKKYPLADEKDIVYKTYEALEEPEEKKTGEI